MESGWYSVWDLRRVRKAQESSWIPHWSTRCHDNLILFSAQQIRILAVVSWGFVDLRALDVERDTRNYKVFDFWLERECACMYVCVRHTCQAVDHSFPPLALSLSLPLHTQFFLLHKHRLSQWDRSRAWFTVQWNYGKGKLPNTRWPMGWFASHRADGLDALWVLQMEMICLFKGKFRRVRLWYALSPVWRSKLWTSIKNPEGQTLQSHGGREIKREEHLSAVQPCGPYCGWLWGPSDLALLMCWASVLALALTSRGNMILKSFIISSFPLLNNTWR